MCVSGIVEFKKIMETNPLRMPIFFYYVLLKCLSRSTVENESTIIDDRSSMV